MVAAVLALLAATARPEQITDWMEEGRLDEARKAVAELKTSAGGAASTSYVDAYLHFLDGDYDGSVSRMREAVSRDKSNASYKGLRDLMTATASLVRDYDKAESEHFIVRFPKGPEEVLVPYALETLEAARAALAADFGWAPPGKVRVEIYSEVRDLAEVSTLTLKEIETSGTIALCKWNRLMIVSPRALMRGYSWLDTLNHEYTHFVVTVLSHNTVPIWLHEGIAKFEERRWRSGPGGGLTPMMEHLLATAIARGRFITFEQMHPSMAKLPSQEDTALAFAEVYTAIEYIWKSKGWQGVRSVIERLKSGTTDAHAVGEATGQSFADWEKGWRKYLAQQHYKLRPGLAPHKLEFKKAGAGEKVKPDDDEGVSELTVEKARRFARLAGMLRARGRNEAAAIEYEKAAAQLPSKEPMLESKLARTYLEIGQLERAAQAGEAATQLAPELAGPHVIVAEIALKQGNKARAEEHLLAALRVNPFDPEIHCSLAEVWGEGLRAEREARACRRLGHP
jgi:tetratricopeptide (TPR) repeat protein